MSIKLTLCAIEFPAEYPLELVKSFIIEHNKAIYKKDLHFVSEQSQLILQHQKYENLDQQFILKKRVEFGGFDSSSDGPLLHAILHFSHAPSDYSYQMYKQQPRGFQVTKQRMIANPEQ